MRHSKATWDFDDANDFKRPLNEVGKKNSILIGKFIKEKMNVIPCLIITSSANRACSTALLVAEQLNYPADKIIKIQDLYLAWSHEILRNIHNIPQDINNCILIGHNPGLTTLINDFGVVLDNLPTSAAMCFEFSTNKWSKVSKKNAELKWFQLVRDLR